MLQLFEACILEQYQDALGPYDRFLEVRKQQTAVRDFIPDVPDAAPHSESFSHAQHETAFKRAGLKMLRACDEKLWNERLSDERKAAIRKWTTLVSADPMSWDIAIQHFSQGSMIFASGGLTDSIKDSLVSKASARCEGKSIISFCVFLQGTCITTLASEGTGRVRFPQERHKFCSYISEEFLDFSEFCLSFAGTQG